MESFETHFSITVKRKNKVEAKQASYSDLLISYHTSFLQQNEN